MKKAVWMFSKRLKICWLSCAIGCAGCLLQYEGRAPQVQVLGTHTACGTECRYDGRGYRCYDLYNEFKCLSFCHSYNLFILSLLHF